MTTVSIASGKGGAGKTSISAALASTFGASCVFADCDVDAANGAIALGAAAGVAEPYFAGPGFSIDGSACTGCGACHDACRFGAIEPAPGAKAFRIVSELCERCGACADRCPVKAVVSYEKQAGELFVSDTRQGMTLVHADLEPGEDTSGKLVALVRRRAEKLAGPDSVIVVDAPPGIGCPVIASMTGCDLVVIVVEASASGIRDAARLVELAATMRRRSIAVINKTGLNAGMDDLARSMLADAGVPIAGEIPFDPKLRSAEESNRTWADLDCESTARVRAALDAVAGAVRSLKERP
jgi:MinD superfamily P-loop ATPase